MPLHKTWATNFNMIWENTFSSYLSHTFIIYFTWSWKMIPNSNNPEMFSERAPSWMPSMENIKAPLSLNLGVTWEFQVLKSPHTSCTFNVVRPELHSSDFWLLCLLLLPYFSGIPSKSLYSGSCYSFQTPPPTPHSYSFGYFIFCPNRGHLS